MRETQSLAISATDYRAKNAGYRDFRMIIERGLLVIARAYVNFTYFLHSTKSTTWSPT